MLNPFLVDPRILRNLCSSQRNLFTHGIHTLTRRCIRTSSRTLEFVSQLCIGRYLIPGNHAQCNGKTC